MKFKVFLVYCNESFGTNSGVKLTEPNWPCNVFDTMSVANDAIRRYGGSNVHYVILPYVDMYSTN